MYVCMMQIFNKEKLGEEQGLVDGKLITRSLKIYIFKSVVKECDRKTENI